MTIPTRWHKPSCDTPQVVVDGNVPKCRTCGSNTSELLRRAAEELAPSYSGIKLPPEVPIGQMDLWWPPGVPYTLKDAPRAQPGPSSGDAASLAPQATDSSLSEIYTSSLGRHQFRLLYLSGAHSINSPIHGDLVVYQRENCPEYETTSYTWGGEDGNATPCMPAYFGDFWDVLFLTRNCWFLLQYLRPPMGTRVIWVDAICINQDSIQERGAQVSCMPQIYRNCMRVVIYPGDHLVRTEQGKFRRMIRHDDLTTHSDINPLHDSDLDIRGSVLQSRYISRVWIIQELILAPHAILALKHHDLDISNDLLHKASWEGGGREWLEFMGQDYRLRQTTLYEALAKTSDSQATDPRDRIFGILGILGVNPTYSKIVPNYSLSMRDCVIGAMGLTLTVSKDIWPLLRTKPPNTTSSCPSWVPSLWTKKTPPPSRNLARQGAIAPGEWATAIHLEIHNRWLKESELRRKLRGPGHMKPQFLLVGSETPWFQDATIDSSSGALTLQLVRVFNKPHEIVEQADESGKVHFLVEKPSASAVFSSAKLPQKPEQPCHVFMAFHGRDFEPDTRLHTEPPPWEASDVYMVLATGAEASGTFSLVSCSRLDDAAFLSASPPPLPLPPMAVERGRAGSVLSLKETLDQTLNYDARQHHLPRRELTSGRFCVSGDTGNASEAMLFDMIIPGKGSAAPGFLQLSLSAARAGETATVTEEFRRAYAACLQTSSAEFNPVLDDEYVWFTLPHHDALSHYWDSVTEHTSDLDIHDGGTLILPLFIGKWRPWDWIFPPWFDMQIPEIGKTLFDGAKCGGAVWPWQRVAGYVSSSLCRCARHQDYEGQGHMRLHYWLPCTARPRELRMPVRVRMPLEKVVEAIRGTELNWLHRHLMAFGEMVSESVDTLLQRGPQPEDSDIYLQQWPKLLADELGFVWRNELVTFV